MGAKPSVLKIEELAWVRDHSLQVSQEYFDRYSPLVSNFRVGTQLQMCTRDCVFMGIRYYHYYITNGVWVIEFGGGQTSDNVVEVHSRRMPTGAMIEKKFTANQDHIRRMMRVIGTTNYSLCLRNCEHVVRYIHSGAWICMQMLPDGQLSKQLMHFMMGQGKKLINQIPADLHEKNTVHKSLYPGREGILRLISSNKQGFSDADENAFNVVFIGPTGSGKSSVINRLFNMVVSKQASSAVSVTREMAIFEGEGFVQLDERGRQGNMRINIIDTIGFCDSAMQPTEVVRLIKFWLKVQKTTIDKVVVVLSGRIEEAHAESIKDMMRWLNFEKHIENFMFVYNKADLVEDEPTLLANIAAMSETLQTGFEQLIVHNSKGEKECLDLNIPLGIPPGASHEESRLSLEPLTKAVFLEVETGRIPVDTSKCAIL